MAKSFSAMVRTLAGCGMRRVRRASKRRSWFTYQTSPTWRPPSGSNACYRIQPGSFRGVLRLSVHTAGPLPAAAAARSRPIAEPPPSADRKQRPHFILPILFASGARCDQSAARHFPDPDLGGAWHSDTHSPSSRQLARSADDASQIAVFRERSSAASKTMPFSEWSVILPERRSGATS